MANQVGPDIVAGTGVPAGQAAGAAAGSDDLARTEPAPGAVRDPGHNHASYHGRPVSWVAVAFIVIGFVVGGLALVFGPTWPVFWVGVGLAVIGALIATTTDIFEDWY
jgi:hypothetical protein